ncbi:hypothetical protein DPMN_094602 [Dreissena polymorpha]|uniref:Uncharacterized protein n=1 Tax=Dreissena polymorpha TaxID=45954 RepID=A0A9D4R3P2_DREPO|nr:hypothetical protein DPMN_094602 [Dreissena polymorpha]
MRAPFDGSGAAGTSPVGSAALGTLATASCSLGRRGGMSHLCARKPVFSPQVIVEPLQGDPDPLFTQAQRENPSLRFILRHVCGR